MKTVDARGLACPEPLMMAQAAVKKADEPVEVLVDSVIPKENICKFAKKKKKDFSVEEREGVFHIVIQS